MHTQTKVPEFIEVQPGLLVNIINMLQNFPYKDVAEHIKVLNEAKYNEGKKIIEVPYATVDACYLMMVRDPMVVTVKGIEKAALYAIDKMKHTETSAKAPDKSQSENVEASPKVPDKSQGE